MENIVIGNATYCVSRVFVGNKSVSELIQKQDSTAWVRRIRKQCGLSVEAFAGYLGVSRNTVWQWESDQVFRKPSRESFSKIVEIAKMRGVDIYDPWRTETLANPAASERKE